MRNTNNRRRGIHWKFMSTLEDLDCADDLALISSKHSDMQEKTRRLHDVTEYTGLKINVDKTKSMRINGKKNDAIRLNDKEVEEVETFLYLGATMDKTGGTEADIGRRLGLARTAFASLTKVWKSAQYSTKTKLKIFNTNVLSVLLYCSELWRTTEKDDEKLDTFHRKCLRRILKIHWPEKISNQQLYDRTRSIPLSRTIKGR
ncbi:uncharacterized protein LOC133177049 [Saccostrea echinata]|uniref:uncharacterized protein LOC133177049 n=1 Tax=Saccostrea echinata TaxID=191078 RepID=UPI002A7F351B|nr:uncharacterized protein LOC133177049 [Saccostrea echinata]